MSRNRTTVDVPDRSADLPANLPAGTRVRLAPTRSLGTVVRAEQDTGGIYVVVRIDRTGGLRCLRPEQLVVAETRRARSPRRS